MKRVKVFKVLALVVGFFIIAIVISTLSWYFQEKRKYNIYILDKTVPDENRTEHKSFNWILNYYKIINKDNKPYRYSKDYFGYFPLKTANGGIEYKIRSLRLSEILSISDELDMVYYTDAYGVNNESFFHHPPDRLRNPSMVYGGLNQNDYLLLSEMRRKNKLIIAEYNILEPPTSDLVRSKTESLFNFSWTGWKGCYFKSLNRSNNALPIGLIDFYEKKYKKNWDFDGSGILLLQEDGDIVVLDQTFFSKISYPQIITDVYAQKTYKLPTVENYSFWFEIIKTDSTNQVIANYQLPLNIKGEQLLKKYGLSAKFPAIIEHHDRYKFYYFAGDFSERNISMLSSYSKGSACVANTLYSKNSTSKSAFFWRFYKPLVYNIIDKNLHFVNN